MWEDEDLNPVDNTVNETSCFAHNTLHLGCAHILPFPPIWIV